MTEQIFKIGLTIFLALGLGSTISSIDQPRKPITTNAALAAVVVTLFILYGLWAWC